VDNKRDISPRSLDTSVRVFNWLVHVRAEDSSLRITVLTLLQAREALDPLQRTGVIGIHVHGKLYAERKVELPRGRLLLKPLVLKATIPYADLEDAPIHNRIAVVYSAGAGAAGAGGDGAAGAAGGDGAAGAAGGAAGGDGFLKSVRYRLLGKRGHGNVKALRTTGDMSVYLRQSSANKAYITQRQKNESDLLSLNRRMTLAYWVTRLLRWPKYVLMYEKESMRYEESASIVFERLIDEGAQNIRYILSEKSSQFSSVPKNYRPFILKKHSFEHYLAFFRAKVFIGSEVPAHAIDLRVANRRAISKINAKGNHFVFLQHGVMYFLALSSAARAVARKGSSVMPAHTQTVVSSPAEARHFIRHGGYRASDLWITGLPKFDRSTHASDADKIAIMPTWRPWEYNQIRTNPTSTGYYQMLETIVDAVPPNLREKIILMPHPLFANTLLGTPLERYLPRSGSYDELLRQTDVLITDYSSIAADAFFRGIKVIFWWKNRADCMKRYGGSLMLNKNNVFGDVAKRPDTLRHMIRKNYEAPQAPEHIRRYRRLVAFNDGHNTQRVIDALKHAGMVQFKEPPLRTATMEEQD
jgi:hypothetical protein